MWPDLQRRLDETEAFEGKPNPELRRVFELMSAVPPMPQAMLESHDRQVAALRERFPNQWALTRVRWDYDALEAHLDFLGPFATIGQAVEHADSLSDDGHRYTVEYLEWDAEPVVRIRSPTLVGLDSQVDLNR
jgi:hypothetical protein